MLTSGILAAAFLGSQHEYRPWKIAVSSALALAGLGTCIVSVVPGKGSIAVRDSVDGVSDQVGGNSFGIPVLFANNKDEVSDAERRALERAVLIFKECGTANIRVVGFASSASFPNDSDSLNNLLANRRAISVVKALEKLGIKAEPHAWGSYPEMARARRVIDSQGRQRLLSEEVRNRRAELIWRESPCSGL